MGDFKRVTPEEARALLYGKYPMEDDSDPMIRPYMNITGWIVQMGEGNYKNTLPDAPYEDAKLLAHATRALWTIAEPPAPQVIRTVEELEALDPNVLLIPSAPEGFEYGVVSAESLLDVVSRSGWKEHLPAIVIATGDQVRAARKALGEVSER